MDVKIVYANDLNITETEIAEITKLSEEYGHLDIKKRTGIRSSALDLVTLLEFSIVSGIGKIIRDAYLKGLLDENYIKSLGENTRKHASSSLKAISNYFSAFYKVFISKKVQTGKAIAFIEQFEGYSIYVVLNEYRSTQKLVDNLAEALVKLCSMISLKQIEIDPPHILQLYPDYSTETWEYVFAPSTQAYGKFIDRYFSFREESFHSINSAEEFINKFQITDFDEFKFIISAKFHSNR
ncbi:hypothetical protein L3C95_14400 [Chitinophaga filiformis]|uniref:hypothetical protein n=1 Tax=Chitinophaga filiformis TaxID=104663 RepID=UPI001F309551|nr:hypothetical protein [Chitinophaga filiformis]MCF6404081.1 hypothetical protein [Chitinophaga filiformis]